MGRTHIIQHWSDAAEYSGELIGNRLRHSEELHMVGSKANLALYADEPTPTKKKRSVREKIVPQEVRLKNLEAAMDELEREYDNGQGQMTTKEYLELSNILDKKYKRAYELLEKAMGWEQELEEQNIPAEDIASFVEGEQQRLDAWTGQLEKANKNKSEKVLTDPRFWHTVFASLEESNFFRKLYFMIRG